MHTQRIVSTLAGPMELGYTPPAPPPKTKIEKVAILLASLENQVAVDLLKRFDPEDVRRIAESSGKLGSLNASDVAPIISEFTAEFIEALGISAGQREINALLEAAFDNNQLATIMGRVPPPKEESVWAKFKLGSEETLAPYLLDEAEQTSAMILSKLSPDLAARCIAKLPRAMAKGVVARMMSLGEIAPVALKIVEETLAADFFAKTTGPDKGVQINRMAAIVNKLDRQQSTDLLNDLSVSHPDDMKSLRKLIFMFEDIERMEQKHRAKLFDAVPTELVIPALFSAEKGLTDAVLSALSARSRRMVESELTGDVSQPRKDTMEARRKIADMAINMSKSGDLALPEAAEEAPAPQA